MATRLPWATEGFAEAGIELRDRAEVAVLASGEKESAEGARAVIVIGRAGRRAVPARLHPVRRFFALPDPQAPHVVLPADRPTVARYVIANWTAAESRTRRIRNAVVAFLIQTASMPTLPRSITVGADRAGLPFVIEPARELGVPPDADFFLTLGLGDILTRAVFQIFPRGSSAPTWAVKFARVPGLTEPFDADERGLHLAAASSVAAPHAPRLLGRYEAAGLPVSVEEAAAGRRLTFILQRPGDRSARLRTIESVASWIVEFGRETASSPDLLGAERNRLRESILPSWLSAGVPGDLVDKVPPVPAVLQHNDLGSWNLIIGQDRFTAVDWESARAGGFPLWDLVYFLIDALLHLDGAWPEARRDAYVRTLLTGRVDSSQVLFRWLRTAVDSLEIPAGAVGSIVTLGWLHHGSSASVRASRLEPLAATRVSGTYGEWMARLWVRSPALGPGWDAWRR